MLSITIVFVFLAVLGLNWEILAASTEDVPDLPYWEFGGLIAECGNTAIPRFNISNKVACFAACANSSDCKYAVFNENPKPRETNDEADNRCWLVPKSIACYPAKGQLDTERFTLLAPNQLQRNFTKIPTQDIFNYTITSAYANDTFYFFDLEIKYFQYLSGACELLCSLVEGCNGFVMHDHMGTTCWLKKFPVGLKGYVPEICEANMNMYVSDPSFVPGTCNGCFEC